MLKKPFDLSEALVEYLGWGKASWPQHNISAVKNLNSSDDLAAAEREIKKVVGALNSIRVDWERHTLASGGQEARQIMKQSFPHLSEEALDALEWSFTFNWK